MRAATRPIVCCALLLAACAAPRAGGEPPSPLPPATEVMPRATLARIYFWRARPGMFDEYTRYIRERAEPIDAEAQRRGAFLTVTTYLSRDTTAGWTHMRVFLLRDSTQLAALGPALDSAGMRVEPDSAARRRRGEYSASLRDAAGSLTVELLR